MLSVLSRWRDLQKPNLIEVLSTLLRGEAPLLEEEQKGLL